VYVPENKNNVPLVRYVNFDVNVVLRRSCIYTYDNIFSCKCIFYTEIGNGKIKRRHVNNDDQRRTKGFARGLFAFVFSTGYERIKKRKERSPPQDDYLFDIIEAV